LTTTELATTIVRSNNQRFKRATTDYVGDFWRSTTVSFVAPGHISMTGIRNCRSNKQEHNAIYTMSDNAPTAKDCTGSSSVRRATDKNATSTILQGLGQTRPRVEPQAYQQRVT